MGMSAVRRSNESSGTDSPLPPGPGGRLRCRDRPALDFLRPGPDCDFKPEQHGKTDEQLKLIDLSAIIAMDDQDSAIYGTISYQAPEIAGTGPTVASDVYTVGRAGRTGHGCAATERPFRRQLPGGYELPVLAAHGSRYRAQRAANPDQPAGSPR